MKGIAWLIFAAVEVAITYVLLAVVIANAVVSLRCGESAIYRHWRLRIVEIVLWLISAVVSFIDFAVRLYWWELIYGIVALILCYLLTQHFYDKATSRPRRRDAWTAIRLPYLARLFEVDRDKDSKNEWAAAEKQLRSNQTSTYTLTDVALMLSRAKQNGWPLKTTTVESTAPRAYRINFARDYRRDDDAPQIRGLCVERDSLCWQIITNIVIPEGSFELILGIGPAEPSYDSSSTQQTIRPPAPLPLRWKGRFFLATKP